MVKEAWHGLGEALRWEREKLGAAGSALSCDASPVCRALTCWPSRLTQMPPSLASREWQGGARCREWPAFTLEQDVCVVGGGTCKGSQPLGGSSKQNGRKEGQKRASGGSTSKRLIYTITQRKWRLHVWFIHGVAVWRPETAARSDRSRPTKPSYCHPGPAPLLWLPSEGMPEGEYGAAETSLAVGG